MTTKAVASLYRIRAGTPAASTNRIAPLPIHRVARYSETGRSSSAPTPQIARVNTTAIVVRSRPVHT